MGKTNHHMTFPHTDDLTAGWPAFAIALWNSMFITTLAGLAVAFPGPNGPWIIAIGTLMAYVYTGSFIASFNSVDLLARSVVNACVDYYDTGYLPRHGTGFRIFIFFMELLGQATGNAIILGLYRIIFGATTFKRFVCKMFLFAPGLISNSNIGVGIGVAVILFVLAYGYTGITYFLFRLDGVKHTGVFGASPAAVAQITLILASYPVFGYITEPFYTLFAGAFSSRTWPAVAPPAGAVFASNANTLVIYVAVPYLAALIGALLGFVAFYYTHDSISGATYSGKDKNSDLSMSSASDFESDGARMAEDGTVFNANAAQAGHGRPSMRR
jgi:hypothetical protein